MVNATKPVANHSGGDDSSPRKTPHTPIVPESKSLVHSRSESCGLRSEEDILADYNYFAKKKQEQLYIQQHDKRKLDAQRRKAKREEALKWRGSGKAALQTVTSRVSEIRIMLKPHHYLRQCMEKLCGYQHLIPAMKLLACRHDKYIGVSHYILELIEKEKYPLHPRHNAKVTMIQRKVLVVRSLHFHHRQINEAAFYQPDAFYLRRKYAQELKLYRFLSRYFAGQVRISTEMRTTLAKKRELLRQAQAKLQLIHDTQEKCAKIEKCKSRQHYNPKGCSNCGVIFMGGTLQGAIPYVISLSRDTGVPSLVTLEFELQLLAEEERIHVAMVNERASDLHRYEQEEVYLLAALQLQPWWSSVLLYRRHLRRLQRRQHSLFYYRIRRLARLKKDVDEWIVQPAPIDCYEVGQQGRYVDLVPELEEYVTLQNFYKRQRIDRYARLFSKKLHVLMEEARERKYQEWLRQQALALAPKPIVIKTLAPSEASIPRKHERYICYRAGCCRRKYLNPYHANMTEKTAVAVASFLTSDRYRIHVRSHHAEDEQRRAILEEQQRMSRLRQKASRQFLEKLHKVREYLLEEIRNAIVPPNPGGGGDTSEIRMSVADEILSWANEGDVNMNEDSLVNSEPVEGANGSDMVRANLLQESIDSVPTMKSRSSTSKHPEQHYRPYSLFHHSYQLLHLFHPGPQMSLELVSKHSTVAGPSSIPLDRYLMRIGTSSACELQISLSGAIAEEQRVQSIHCLLYIQDQEFVSQSLSSSAATTSTEPSLVVNIVDNYSVFGTYVVGESGAKKVSTRLAQGSLLTPGALLCIGVQRDGPSELSVADASLACLVYKFHIEGAL